MVLPQWLVNPLQIKIGLMSSSTDPDQHVHLHSDHGLVFAKLMCTIGQPFSCWTRICPAFANSVDQDQLASEETN